jgi:hypothetical protein
MKRTIAVLVMMAASAGTASVAADARTGHYDDPAYGFSMAVPSLGSSAGVPMVQRLGVAAPVRDGFAANCNVQVQFSKDDFDSFVGLSLRQFTAAGLKVLQQSPKKVSGQPAIVWEYSGQLAGHDLQFLALAVYGGDRVWLLTCSALAKTFADYKQAFGEVIDSFAVTKPTPGHS